MVFVKMTGNRLDATNYFVKVSYYVGMKSRGGKQKATDLDLLYKRRSPNGAAATNNPGITPIGGMR